MAKFDVYRVADATMLIDCQSDLLQHLNTRFMVPLVFSDAGVCVDSRLTPMLRVAGNEMLMLTHLAAAVSAHMLGPRIASVENQEYIVANALDMLISGF